MIINKIFSDAGDIIRQDNKTLLEQTKNAVRDVKVDNIKNNSPKLLSEPLSGPLSEKDNVSVSGIWAKVAKEINVREARPGDIMTLSNALYKAGAISYDDHINLSFQPEINHDTPLESKPFSHEQKDYIALWQTKERNVLRFGGDRQQIEDTHRIQAILTYVDSLK
ncbi:MAG: hypothetical protein K9G26_05485 [Emcibacter sp.]|nr:hypothetical protein [Emcibacter sp.]